MSFKFTINLFSVTCIELKLVSVYSRLYDARYKLDSFSSLASVNEFYLYLA